MIGWKGGALLLAILVALGVYAYQTRPQPKPEKPGFVPCDLLTTVMVDIRGGDRQFHVERASPSEPWRVTAPVAAEGDPATMATLVSAIHAVRVINTIPAPLAPGEYGLATPRLAVTCRVRTGPSFTLSVGNRSFDSSGQYAQKSGDSRVFVISSVEVDDFERALAEPPVRPSPSPSK